MEDEEEDSLPTPLLMHKAKARPVIEGAQQLTCACKPSAHLKQLMVGEGSADGSVHTYMGWHLYHVLLTELNADTDIGHAKYAYLAGFDDLIATAIKEVEGDPKSVHKA
jgi:hypothetical protein